MITKKSLRQMIGLALAVLLVAGCGGAPTEPAIETTPPNAGRATPDTIAPGSYERFDINEDLYVRQVQEGVFVITHSFPWAGNSLIVEMASSDLVLVDTPYTPEATKDLLEWIAARLGEREITAINTGYHYDNLGGNSYLIEQGIPVYGADLTAELIDERGEELRAMTLESLKASQHKRYYQVHGTLPYVAPTHLFALDQGLELEFGKEVVQIYYPGPSHAPDNVVVYFPIRKILFGGCMIFGWNGVGNTSEADLEAWPESVRNLYQFDCDLIVPGHGDRLDPGLLEHTVSLLTEYEE